MKPGAARRLAKADQFLGQIQKLSVNETPEAIIHLTYYAMLHVAVAVLLMRRGQAPKTHSSVIGQFSQLMQSEGAKGQAMSRAFNRSEDRRIASDYADHIVPTGEDASRARDRANDFVSYCHTLIEA